MNDEIETCGETVDDGQRICTSPVTAEVTWPGGDGNPHIRRVCNDCADWLMGLGAAHLGPKRRAL